MIFLWNIFFWIPYIHSSICQKGHIQKHILVTVLLVSKLLPPSICSFCGYKKYDIFGHQGHSVFLTGSTDDDCQTSPSMVAFCFNFLFWQRVCDVLPVEQFARFFFSTMTNYRANRNFVNSFHTSEIFHGSLFIILGVTRNYIMMI